jgi:hypothetical protein
LMGRGGYYPIKGFFHPDNFTFGTPLRRSALEAVIHEVNGVHSVIQMNVRERGRSGFRLFDELVFKATPNQVIRVENNPLYPERGTLKLVTRQ